MNPWRWSYAAVVLALMAVGGGLLFAAAPNDLAGGPYRVVAVGPPVSGLDGAEGRPGDGGKSPEGRGGAAGAVPDRGGAAFPDGGGAPSAPIPQSRPSLEAMLSGLNLTPGQRQELRAIQAGMEKDLRRIEASPAATEAKADRQRAVRHAARERVERLLTLEQRRRLESDGAAASGAPRGLRMRSPEAMAWALERLHLTPQQQEQLMPASLEILAARRQYEGRWPTVAEQARFRAAVDRLTQQLPRMLTSSQQQQLAAMLRRPEGTGVGGPLRRVGGLLVEAARELELPADGQKAIEAVVERYQPEFRRLREEMEASGVDFSQWRERTRPLREKMEAEALALVPPDRRAKFLQKLDELRQRRRGPWGPVSTPLPRARV